MYMYIIYIYIHTHYIYIKVISMDTKCCNEEMSSLIFIN